MNKYEGSTSIQAVYKNRDVKDPKAVKIVHPLLQKQGMLFQPFAELKLFSSTKSPFNLYGYWTICFAENNPCRNGNGGCHHMCVITKVSESENLGYRCACNVGWALGNDLKTCISKLDINFAS